MILLYNISLDSLLLYWYNGIEWRHSTWLNGFEKWTEDKRSYMETLQVIKEAWFNYDVIHEELP